MKTNGYVLLTVTSFCIAMLSLNHPAAALEIDLVGMLTKNLDVTETQAKGGAGAIFDAASQKLSADDFAEVTKALPEVTSLMGEAPKAKKSTSTLGGLSGLLDKDDGGLSSLAGLSDTFSQMGLSSDMVGKFIPIILQYAQSKGGDKISNLLGSVLQ